MYFSLFLLLISICSINGDVLKETCKCQPYQECQWSKNFDDKLKIIRAATREGWYRSFRASICDQKQMFVWCCENTKGESVQPADEDHLEDLNKQYLANSCGNKVSHGQLYILAMHAILFTVFRLHCASNSSQPQI